MKKTLTTDLAERLALLDVRHSVVFQTKTEPITDSFLSLAVDLAAGLRKGDKDAVARVRGIVDPSELTGPTLGADGFWATELGRWLFAAGGYPDTSLTRTAAAHILDCSRQWIHELVTKGTLKASPSRTSIDREVYATEVQNLLKARLTRPPAIDKAVK